MELLRYLALFRSRWLLLTAAVAVAVATAYAMAPKTDIYTARSTLYIGSRTIDPDSRDLSGDRAAALDRLVLTFGVMIDSEPIAAQALQRTGLQRSAASVVAATETEAEPATQLLYVDVRDTDPATAQALAIALTNSFVEAVQDFEPGTATGEGAVPALPAYVFESAKLPTVPESHNLLKDLALAAVLGLAASCALVLLIDYLDVTIRDADDAERRLELPVIGVIPDFGASLTGEAARR